MRAMQTIVAAAEAWRVEGHHCGMVEEVVATVVATYAVVAYPKGMASGRQRGHSSWVHGCGVDNGVRYTVSTATKLYLLAGGGVYFLRSFGKVVELWPVLLY